jgi:hypothetical protein
MCGGGFSLEEKNWNKARLSKLPLKTYGSLLHNNVFDGEFFNIKAFGVGI